MKCCCALWLASYGCTNAIRELHSHVKIDGRVTTSTSLPKCSSCVYVFVRSSVWMQQKDVTVAVVIPFGCFAGFIKLNSPTKKQREDEHAVMETFISVTAYCLDILVHKSLFILRVLLISGPWLWVNHRSSATSQSKRQRALVVQIVSEYHFEVLIKLLGPNCLYYKLQMLETSLIESHILWWVVFLMDLQ